MAAPLPIDDLEWRFAYHAPDEDRRKRHEQVRDACLTLAKAIDALCPNGREKSTAITKVEEAGFWANAAIARER
jgi:hypothetical protein